MACWLLTTHVCDMWSTSETLGTWGTGGGGAPVLFYLVSLSSCESGGSIWKVLSFCCMVSLWILPLRLSKSQIQINCCTSDQLSPVQQSLLDTGSIMGVLTAKYIDNWMHCACSVQEMLPGDIPVLIPDPGMKLPGRLKGILQMKLN